MGFVAYYLGLGRRWDYWCQGEVRCRKSFRMGQCLGSKARQWFLFSDLFLTLLFLGMEAHEVCTVLFRQGSVFMSDWDGGEVMFLCLLGILEVENSFKQGFRRSAVLISYILCVWRRILGARVVFYICSWELSSMASSSTNRCPSLYLDFYSLWRCWLKS